MKGLSEQMLSRFRHLPIDNEATSNAANNLHQVPLSQPTLFESNEQISTVDGQTVNLFSNLLLLQTAAQTSDKISAEQVEPYLKRIEQSPLVRNDRDLQQVRSAFYSLNIPMLSIVVSVGWI